MFDYYVSRLCEVTAFMQSSSFYGIEDVATFVMASFGAGLGSGIGVALGLYCWAKFWHWVGMCFGKWLNGRSKSS